MRKTILLSLFLLAPGLLPGQTREIDSVALVVATARNDSIKADALADLTWLMKYSDPAKALTYGWQSIALCEKNNYEELKAHALNSVGITYWAKGEYDSAQNYLERVGAIYRKLKKDRGEALTYTNLGLIFQNKGNYEKSLEYALQGLRIMEKLDDQGMLASGFLNLGNVYFLREEFDLAKTYYFKSLRIKKKIAINPLGQNIQKTLGNIANVYQKLKMPDSAFYYFKLAIPYAIQVADLKNLCLAYTEVGLTFSNEKQFDSALFYYDKALAIYNGGKFVNQYDRSVLLQSMSQTWMEKGQMQKAIQYGVQSLDIAKSIKSVNKLKDTYGLLALVYEKSGRVADALNAHKMFAVYKDSLISIEKNKQIAELQTQYETEKKNQQITLLNQENQLKTATLERSYLMVGILAAVLALGVLVFYLWRNRNLERQRAVLQEQKLRLREAQVNAVIDSQEKERRRFATDLHDGMGQLISALQLNIQSLRQENGNFEKRDHLFEGSEMLLSEVHDEIRNIAFNLMPPILVREGLIPAVNELVRKINRSGKLKAVVTDFDASQRFNELAEISIYRIIQEFLSNIIKYAQAAKVAISFTGHDDELILTIDDDGQGYNLTEFQNSEGNGWRNIHSRINLLKAEIEIDTQPGRHNNTVIITVPSVSLVPTKTKILAPQNTDQQV